MYLAQSRGLARWSFLFSLALVLASCGEIVGTDNGNDPPEEDPTENEGENEPPPPPPPPDPGLAPNISGGYPAHELAGGVGATIIAVATDKAATCGWSTVPGTPFTTMTAFSSTGGQEHVALYAGLQDGGAYSAYVRCDDGAGNVNESDYEVSFTVGVLPAASPPGSPRIMHSQPRGDLASGTTGTVLHVITDEAAVCAWSDQSGTDYSQMTPFEQTNTTGHATPLVGLQDGRAYQVFVRCRDSGGSTNDSDYTVAFSVGQSTPAPSSPAQLSNLSASSGRAYVAVEAGFAATDLFPQESSVHQYIDRNREFRTIPPHFVGATYVRTANDDKNLSPSDADFLSFDVGEEVAVFIAHDDRVNPRPDWLDGFEDTGLDVFNEKDDTGGFSVMLAIFPAGRVTLGSNVAMDMGPPVSMYTVIVAPAAQLPSLLPH